MAQSPVDDEYSGSTAISRCIQLRYEYEGASGCLVITPLTDRCWMTITGAYIYVLRKSVGPAGTALTESSKDLAKVLLQCIVFNCSDQIGYSRWVNSSWTFFGRCMDMLG